MEFLRKLICKFRGHKWGLTGFDLNKDGKSRTNAQFYRDYIYNIYNNKYKCSCCNLESNSIFR